MRKNQEAKDLLDKVKEISRKNENKRFVCFRSNGTPYNFNSLEMIFSIVRF